VKKTLKTYKNVITRAIGTNPCVKPEIYSTPFLSKDHFLLCTDGLTDFVTKEEERITKDSRDQSYPKVEGSKVFWLDNARDQSKKEQGINNLYYEDF